MPSGKFEIWFVSDDEVSVFLETDYENGPINVREMLEVYVVASVAAGVIANLSKPVAMALSTRLAEFRWPASYEDIPHSVDGFSLVLPRQEGRRKGFEGTCVLKGGQPVSRWKPRGFPLFGPEVQDYSQTATMALFLNVLAGVTENSRFMLVEAAHKLGLLGQLGAIKMRNHPSVAEHALEEATEAAAEYARRTPERSDPA